MKNLGCYIALGFGLLATLFSAGCNDKTIERIVLNENRAVIGEPLYVNYKKGNGNIDHLDIIMRRGSLSHTYGVNCARYNALMAKSMIEEEIRDRDDHAIILNAKTDTLGNNYSIKELEMPDGTKLRLEE